MLWFLAGFLHIPKFQKLLVQSQIAKGVDQLIVTSDFCIPLQVFAVMAHSAQPLLFIMPIVASSPLLGSGQDVNVIFYILDLLGELTHSCMSSTDGNSFPRRAANILGTNKRNLGGDLS